MLVKIASDLTVGVVSARVSSSRRRLLHRQYSSAMATDVFVFLCAALCVHLATCQFGFFPQREERRFNPFGNVQNFLQNPRRTLETILNFGPARGNQNRPGIINEQYYGPPYTQNNLNPNQNYYNNIRYPNREYNNGRDVVFEPTTNNPFDNNFNPNYYPNQAFTTERSIGEFAINVEDNANNGNFNEPNYENGNNIPNVPPPGTEEGINGIPDVAQSGFEDRNNGIPNVPPPGIEEGSNGIPNVPPPGTEEGSNGIPNVPPPGIEEGNNGIPNVPPPGIEEGNNGIPNVPPPGIEEGNNGIPNVPPPGTEEGSNGIPDGASTGFENKNLGPSGTSITTLPPLTPVPTSELKNNFNFDGLFSESCTTIEGGIGSCINVFQCPPYLQLLQQSQTNPSAVQVLRKVHCGFEGNNPKVCCPRLNIPTVPPTQRPVSEATQPPSTNSPIPSPKSLPDDDFVTAFPEPPDCGVSNASLTRVVGGIDAKLGDFLWMALLGYRDRRGQGVKWLCGGSLVTSKHILTAAHCIHGHEDDLYLVRLGELDLARDDEGAAPIDVLIKSKIKHEEYNAKSFTNDIGILVMDRHVTFTDLIRPICIPVDSELRARSFVNYNPIIAGWGDTEFRGPAATHLQALQLPVVSNEQCAQAYSQYKAQVIDDRVLCAGYKDGGKDACQGDSGGPLMQPIWNSKKFTTHFYQIGVVSYGRKCAEAGFPGVYTRVTKFVPWLEKTILGKV